MVRLAAAPSDSGTHFYAPCPVCQTIVTGETHGRTPEDYKVNFHDAEKLSAHGEFAGVVTIDPNIPLKRDTWHLGEKGGAPTATLINLLGTNNLPRFMEASGKFRSFRTEGWPDFQRWYDFYLQEKWEHFDRISREQYGDDWEEPHYQADRDSYAYRALFFSLSMCSVIDSRANAKIFDEFCTKLEVTIPSQAYSNYISATVADGTINVLQKRLWDCIRLFMRMSDSWLPGLLFDLISENPGVDPGELQLCRDEFHQLRDMYISCFEACCKTLVYFVEFQNTITRGRPDAFPGQLPTTLQNPGKRPVTTHRQFEKLPNYEKLCYLEEWPSLEVRMSSILDNKLRNALGHNSIRHDLRTGDIVDDAGFRMTYFEFCSKVYRLASALQMSSFMVHILKIESHVDVPAA